MNYPGILALGTVQFGKPYGVANESGQIPPAEAAALLHFARESGIDTLDTAAAYGGSEQRLGDIGVASWRIVSKTPAWPGGARNVAEWMRGTALGSLSRLRVSHLYGLLLHQPGQLLEEDGGVLYEALLSLKREGLVDKVGISIYDPEALESILPRFPMDIVQAPFNVLDRRLETSGWLSRMRALGMEIHVRSIFLQGLLLMKAERRPPYFARWQPIWDQWGQWLEAESLRPLDACLGFVASTPGVDRIVVGVDSSAHLREILAAKPNSQSRPSVRCADIDLINPSRWILE